jgi:uncharacterized protein
MATEFARDHRSDAVGASHGSRQTMNTALTLSSPGERIAVVDVLRAYALFGIIITHSVTGFLAGQEPVPDFMLCTPLDRAVAQLEHLFTFGKFYSIFSFLFGLSFAIQLRNAMQKGAGFSGRFAWRLVVLALIAVVHGAFFAGDILIVYALLGLLLIPFRSMKTKTLVIVGLILSLNVPGLLLGAAYLAIPAPSPEQLQSNAQMQAQFLQIAQQQFVIKQSGTLAELVQANYTNGVIGKMLFMVITGRLWITFGLFLLGMCAGRLELFKDSEANRAFFRKLLWPAGLAALVTTVIEWRYPMGEQLLSSVDLLHWFSLMVQQISLSTFYVAGITLLYWRRPSQGLLPSLAPVGRMGLTTYLGQTVFGVVVFYGLGFGLLGKIGAAAAVGAAIAFFVLQALLAHWWAKRFKMGPAEWLWRSLTYFKLQPNHRAVAGTV